MVFLPSLSSQVSNCKVESSIMGRDESQVSPFTFAASTLRASPSLMLLAISCELVPFGYSLTFLSGKVIDHNFMGNKKGEDNKIFSFLLTSLKCFSNFLNFLNKSYSEPKRNFRN